MKPVGRQVSTPAARPTLDVHPAVRTKASRAMQYQAFDLVKYDVLDIIWHDVAEEVESA